jgi:hypothetical protein
VITGSILLALVAAVFLGLGLAAHADAEVYLYGSIVSSVLAGFALFAGLRYRPGAQLPDDDFDGPLPSDRRRAAAPERVARRATGRASVTSSGWEEGVSAGSPWPDDAAPPASGLPDEPAQQELSLAIAAQVARLSTGVVVIDGRPRYHLVDCLHLLGRTIHRLPVTEAVELGFTPCGDCEPATVLLAAVRG